MAVPSSFAAVAGPAPGEKKLQLPQRIDCMDGFWRKQRLAIEFEQQPDENNLYNLHDQQL